ncbi:MAG: PIN domain-containing protein [Candidatus Diapherotrites archaeon]|uniref:PIN domain-containing protein n=1 Tax=Candidatus Iainarchaeum sp. TaxID=3101447 RepID=A0A8T4L8T3_9ARCH|nr:PIN domain-containing protein [Candidatus Diapherotrites archaeon]
MSPAPKQRVYLDANIFIAFVKADMGKPFKLMYQDVEDFFDACPERFTVVLSDYVFREIKRIAYHSAQEVLDFFREREISVEVTESTGRCTSLAEEFRGKGVPSMDALHAAIAIEAHCDALMTFNKKDFVLAAGLIRVVAPRDLIE